MAIRIITAKQVDQLLPMAQAIELMREAFGALARGEAVMPQRARVLAGTGDMLVMPAYLPGHALSLKAVLTYPGNSKLNLPAVQGLLLVFDHETGTPRALIDAEHLTALRTGAAGGLAIDLLARKDASTVAMIGCGVQGWVQVQAACCARDIECVWLVDRDPDRAAHLAQKVGQLPNAPRREIAGTSDEAVEQADIIITATPSPTPTFDGKRVKPGTHVNAFGAYTPDRREVDEHLVGRAYVVVDQREAALTEAGDIILAGAEPDAEIGGVVIGREPARSDDQQITFFKSVGLAVQDAAAAGFVLEEAARQDVGTLVEM